MFLSFNTDVKASKWWNNYLELWELYMPLWMIVIEWSARLILLLLVGLSVWSFAIIIERRRFLKDFDLEKEFLDIKAQAEKLSKENIKIGLTRHFYGLQTRLQKGLGVLGTLGSTTPFIGLLGTILGIIVAFGELSNGGAGTNAIMFALAEALILTAVGLFVAIPAVISFNLFSKKSKHLIGDLQSRLDEFIAKEK
jgi:biopolymer transport protein ExbB/TolQ